ncbi:MAG: TPM domain-containing protein [Flavobacteriales bacterium]|nr:TPM domain-containing protein [Flavobacteriales bacterium]
MGAREAFTKEEQENIVSAIKKAELATSGEIRVHIEKKCSGDPLDSAAHWFAKLDMHKTELRNGVLIYLATEDRKFAVIGDVGINQKVPSDFWDSTKQKMIDHFRNDALSKGLILGIEEAGKQLKSYFPWKTDDINELSDEISFGDEIKK